MLWAYIAAGFLLAATMGAALASILATIRPEWQLRRRRLVASAVLPAITLGLSLLVALAFFITTDPSMRDLVVIAVLEWGAAFALLALVGAAFGSLLSRRGRQ